VTERFGTAARLRAEGEFLWYDSPLLRLAPGVPHGVTHASLGNFSLTAARGAAETAAVHERRRRFLVGVGLGEAKLVTPRLHHTATVGVVEGGELHEERCDALVTAEAATVLAVTVADCVPVFFIDVARLVTGVAHAGWRGLAQGVVRNTLAVMRKRFGCRNAEILVATGPAIRGPSYEVGPEVGGLFPEQFSVPAGDPAAGRFLLDLPRCALAEARAAGVPGENVADFSLCTASHPGDLFSYRRGDPGRHWAFIGRP
jgi:YfiH family protein